jgi:hypothetical protein
MRACADDLYARGMPAVAHALTLGPFERIPPTDHVQVIATQGGGILIARKMAARQMHRTQMETAPRAGDSRRPARMFYSRGASG